MAYSYEEEQKMLAMFESIGNQPIETPLPYNEVRNPKPIVESTAFFEGTKVDLGKWTADSKKVGKAKTAENKDLSKGKKETKEVLNSAKPSEKQVTETDNVTEKKEKGQITAFVTEDSSHEAKDEPTPKSGSFDTAAKNAASGNRSKAEDNKKFAEASKTQRKFDMLGKFVKSLAIDAKSTEDANKVLKKVEKMRKAKLESIGFAEKDGVLVEMANSSAYIDWMNDGNVIEDEAYSKETMAANIIADIFKKNPSLKNYIIDGLIYDMSEHRNSNSNRDECWNDTWTMLDDFKEIIPSLKELQRLVKPYGITFEKSGTVEHRCKFGAKYDMVQIRVDYKDVKPDVNDTDNVPVGEIPAP